MNNILEQIGDRIGKAQVKRPFAFFAITIFILIAFIPGIFLLPSNIEPSIEKLMPSQTQEVKLMNEMRQEFGADMMYIVITPTYMNADLTEPKTLEYIDLVAEKVQYNEHILQTRSMVDAIRQYHQGEIPQEKHLVDQVLNDIPEEQKRMFLDPLESTTYIEVRTDTGANAKLIAQVIQSVEDDINSLEEYNPGVKTSITGFGTIDKATFEVIVSDFTSITGVSFLGLVIFLFFYFQRSLKKTMLAVSVIMVALLITMGATGYLDFTITVMTMVAAAMIMALGISYGIHITHSYFTLRKKQSVASATRTLQQDLFRALLGSSLTTSAGFLALLFGIMPAMKVLGIVLAMGIMITFLAGVFFVPALLVMTDKEKGGVRKVRRRTIKTG